MRQAVPARCSIGARTRGFTYVGVLIGVVILGLVLASVGMTWRHHAQREKEAELLFVGRQYRAAIESFLRASPGAAELPRSLEDLIEDRRFPQIRRHLRKLFPDPMTGGTDWELIKSGGRIVGVASRSGGMPFRLAGFSTAEDSFAEAQSYRDWRFVASSTSKGPGAAGATVAAAPAVPAAPIVSVEPPAPVITVPPVPRPESDAACDDQRQTDFSRCSEARTNASASASASASATSAEIATCLVSVNARYLACRRRGPIPPLAVPASR